MRKDELLYFHQLLAAIRAEYERREGPPPDAFAAYDELSVSPVAAYAPKSEHRRAVRTLAAALAAVCAPEQGDHADTEACQPASS